MFQDNFFRLFENDVSPFGYVSIVRGVASDRWYREINKRR